METTNLMDVPGYERLSDVLQRAYAQAASGKGRQRHVSAAEPFHEQLMQIGARKFGVGSLLFQAFKKSEESQRLPLDRGVAELLGAIVYLAGAVIAREDAEAKAELPPLAPGAVDALIDEMVFETKWSPWIDWNGTGHLPLSRGDVVRIKQRDGAYFISKYGDGAAARDRWFRGVIEQDSDIVAYSIASPA